MEKKKGMKAEKMYSIVEKLHAQPKEATHKKPKYNFNDPTALRALKIHRHLRALEDEILDSGEKRVIELELDQKTKQIVLIIRNKEIHCNRVAYLSAREFSLLRKNRKVANILKKCPDWQNVA